MNKAGVTLLLIAGLMLLAPGLFAQSLLDNPDYKKGVDLRRQAQEAYNSGDYDRSVQLSAEAKTYFDRSDAYVAATLLMYRAQNRYTMARDRVAYFHDVGVDPEYQPVFDQAQADLTAAKSALDAKRYQDSIDLSQKVLDALAPLKPAKGK
jgi:hypothetical protein